MKSALKPALLAAFSSLMLASGARAAVVFADNFDAESLGLNYTGFANFTVTAGSVDLIGNPGFFDLNPGNGRYVDLDGTTLGRNPAGTITTNATFAAGNYVLTFNLAGSGRGDTNTVAVKLGGFLTNITLASNAGVTSQLYSFATTGGKLSFTNLGPSDNIGLLLDNVRLSTAVPEASTWMMMLLGFAGLGFAGYRRKRVAILA